MFQTGQVEGVPVLKVVIEKAFGNPDITYAVQGSALISVFPKLIGNSRQTINALILTHSHPDHIGAARSIKEGYDSCIYACQGEKDWIEDTGLQYKERPIPN